MFHSLIVCIRFLHRLRMETNDKIVLISNYTQTLDIFERMCRSKKFVSFHGVAPLGDTYISMLDMAISVWTEPWVSNSVKNLSTSSTTQRARSSYSCLVAKLVDAVSISSAQTDLSCSTPVSVVFPFQPRHKYSSRTIRLEPSCGPTGACSRLA